MRFAVHTWTVFTSLVPNDLVVKISDLDTDRKAAGILVRIVRILNSHRKEIVLDRNRSAVLRPGLEIGDLVRVTLLLDLVLIQQRHTARAVVEDRRPFPAVREVNRAIVVDRQTDLADRHHDQIFVIPVRHEKYSAVNHVNRMIAFIATVYRIPVSMIRTRVKRRDRAGKV